MFSCPESPWTRAAIGLALWAASWGAVAQSTSYPGIGRVATPKEVAAWDIDVRPDFKGLPKGSGSVSAGQDIWETKCASCHGVFGESNEVFAPLVGGVGPKDLETGRVAKLLDESFPGRTTLMKVSTVSTLWDYIHRAMPWNAPKSLKTDEVYAVTAFLLNLGGIVPDNFVLSDQTMADVQKRMPNRNGMRTDHAMWPGKEFGGAAKPDALNTACMKNCAPEPKLASLLPDHARNAHGNLADQNRPVGAQRGAQTAPAGAGAAAKPVASANAAAMALATKSSCTACHGMDKKIVGPSFQEIGVKHAGKADYLAGKIRQGGSGVWGSIPMPPQSLSDSDTKALAEWLAAGAKP